MIGETVRSLAKRLRDEFEGYEVYTEGVYMGAEKPCFFIECEKAEKIPLLGKRFMVRASLAVTLESESDTKRKEAEDAAVRIFEVMSWLDVGERKVRGRSLNGRMEDGKLVMRGVYDLFMIEEAFDEEAAMMESVELKKEVIW